MDCSTSSVKQLNVLLNRPAPRSSHHWEEEFVESQVPQFQDSSLQLENVNLQLAVAKHEQMVNWNQEFQFYQRPVQGNEWTREFKNHKDNNNDNWSSEFKNVSSLDWENEFTKVLSISDSNQTCNQTMPQGQVAQTASSIVDALSSHEKLKNSNFMDFMVKLQNSDLVIEKNKVLVPIEPFKETQSLLKNGKLKQVSWEEEFSGSSFERQGQSNNTNHVWSKEFNRKYSQSWKNEFLNSNSQDGIYQMDHQSNQDLNQEFWDFNGKTHGDWVKEFDKEIQYLQNRGISDPLMEQMDQLQGQNLNLQNNSMEYYAFSPFNPYLKQKPKELLEFLETAVVNQLSSERILRLEALLQQAPGNTSPALWHQLGLAQQENENDLNAIAAFKNALSLNPTQLESWLLLSASYTNESFMTEACGALESWFANNSEYSFPAASTAIHSLEDRQNLLLSKYLNVVRSAKIIDADIQIGMGVLLTMKNEYQKAIDCFNAALSLRPNDYILWNKLGATLANSNDSEGAIRAYIRALEINPTYIRARCNLAIACIQLSQYKEAAEHLITSLSIQSEYNAKNSNNHPTAGVQSATVWGTLKMVVDGYLNRPDLKDACERRDIQALKRIF